MKLRDLKYMNTSVGTRRLAHAVYASAVRKPEKLNDRRARPSVHQLAVAGLSFVFA
jgi:hypothetical protein